MSPRLGDANLALIELLGRDRPDIVDPAVKPDLEPPYTGNGPLIPVAIPKPDWARERQLADAEDARRQAAQAQAELEPDPPARPRKWGLKR
jgi:hypothetical protein